MGSLLFTLVSSSLLTQHQVAELQRQFDLIRLSCTSLMKTHGRAVQQCKQNGEQLSGDSLVDRMYTHREVSGCGWLVSVVWGLPGGLSGGSLVMKRREM